MNEVLPFVALNVLLDKVIKSANESAEGNSLQIYRVLKLVDTFLKFTVSPNALLDYLSFQFKLREIIIFLIE